jgi:simple sugar transport system permease protein
MGLAAMNFGSGHPVFAALGALIFGFTDAVSSRLQSFGFPAQLLLMLPYLTTVLVLAIAMIRTKKKEKADLFKQSAMDL